MTDDDMTAPAEVSIPSSGNLFIGATAQTSIRFEEPRLNPLIGEPLHRGTKRPSEALDELLVSIPSSGNLFIGVDVLV